MLKRIFILMLVLLPLLSPGQDMRTFLEKGVAAMDTGNYEAALENFRVEREINPSPELKHKMAECHFNIGNYERSKELLLEVYYSEIDLGLLPSTLLNLGSSYAKLDEIDSAEHYFDRVTTQFPKWAPGFFTYGYMLKTNGDPLEAIDMYSAGLALDSSYWKPFMERQEAYYMVQNYDAAVDDLLKAKELKPDLKIEFNLAYAYSMMGEYKKADSLFSMLEEERQNDPLFLNNYGFNKFQLGEHKEGIKLIEKSLEIKPDNSFAHRNLAFIYYDLDKQGKACSHLDKALELGFTREYGSEVQNLKDRYCHQE